jgi:hypothetical protein
VQAQQIQQLGGLLEHRPYRFCEDAEVEVLLPDDPRDLLPYSTGPVVTGQRSVTTPAHGV